MKILKHLFKTRADKITGGILTGLVGLFGTGYLIQKKK